MESRLHFRIHATRLSLSQLVEEDPVSESLSKEEDEGSFTMEDSVAAGITSPDTDLKTNGATALS